MDRFEQYKQTLNHEQVIETDQLIISHITNVGSLPVIEDKMLIESAIEINNKKISIFGIFDGHNGNGVSSYISSHFKNLFYEIVPITKNYTEALQLTFEKLEYDIFQNETLNESGSTAVVLVLEYKEDKIYGYLSWIGDSIAVLYQEKKLNYLVNVHDLENKQELRRVIKSGVEIEDKRIGGVIQLTRTLGDKNLKKIYKNVLLGKGEQKSFMIDENVEFMMLLSDGIFESVDTESFKIFINETFEQIEPQSLPYVITKKCYYNDPVWFISEDDITIIMIIFKRYKKQNKL